MTCGARKLGPRGHAATASAPVRRVDERQRSDILILSNERRTWSPPNREASSSAFWLAPVEGTKRVIGAPEVSGVAIRVRRNSAGRRGAGLRVDKLTVVKRQSCQPQILWFSLRVAIGGDEIHPAEMGRTMAKAAKSGKSSKPTKAALSKAGRTLASDGTSKPAKSKAGSTLGKG